MKELLGLAAQGLTVHDDPSAVDAIMARADRLRRRRRIALATCSAVAVVAVGVGTALLPQPGMGAPNTRIAASELPVPPAVPSPAAPERTPQDRTPGTVPGTSPTPSATTSAESAPPPAPTPTETSSAPSTASTPATKTPTTQATSRPPTTKSPASSAPSPTAADSTTNTRNPTPAQVVAGRLPPDAGTVTKDSRATAASQSHPLGGTYLVTKNGRTGIVQVAIHDPAVNPDQPYRTVEDELTYNHCAPDPYAPPNTDCTTQQRSDGSVVKTWTRPGNQPDSESSLVYGKGYAASVTYPDGRAVVITSLAGITGSDEYGTPMDAPPLDKATVAEVARDTSWFAS
ncbi:hypothetical protein [Yinghuangia sp. YIM S10712]|uniref:hypothetical protein n=1 Tax=Yinghuangia sp. YIM S10712 TaxID=3436930 RepID=UPI003F530D7C